jgi:hypothetical protein
MASTVPLQSFDMVLQAPSKRWKGQPSKFKPPEQLPEPLGALHELLLLRDRCVIAPIDKLRPVRPGLLRLVFSNFWRFFCTRLSRQKQSGSASGPGSCETKVIISVCALFELLKVDEVMRLSLSRASRAGGWVWGSQGSC